MSKSTRQNNRKIKREQIFDAAISVFADKGYHSSRIADIATAANVADGTIYLYFRNKEDLLLSIFEDKMTIMITELEAVLEGVESPSECLKLCAEQHFIQIQRYPQLAKVIQVELRQSQRFFRDYRPEKLWQYLSIFIVSIEKGQELDQFRSDIPPDILAWSFFGALDELSVQWVLSKNRERFKFDTLSTSLAEIFITGIQIKSNLEKENLS